MNLILLVGTNPLPNYVVAKYFMDSYDNLKNIFFVISSGNKSQSSTREFADNITKVLNSNYENKNVNFIYVALSNIEDQKTNINDLSSGFEEIGLHENIHLNYTGGTKTMGIHVYNFLKEKYKENFENSYLSAKLFKLINENGELVTEDLRKKVILKFEDLITLHGFKRDNKDFEFGFENAMKKFEEYIERDELDKYFDSFNRKNFTSNSNKLIERKKDLKKDIRINGVILKINNLLPPESQLFNSYGEVLENLPEDKNIKNTIQFIDGKWLEEYLYKIIKENIPENINILKNWEVKKPTWPNNLKFELDVILINGYQLCGLSVTTISKKANCKHKGFEIIMRTRQIGGDEAKSVLVTRLNEQPVKELQNELEIDTGGTSKNILVLGKDDFKKENLLNKLKYFMEINI